MPAGLAALWAACLSPNPQERPSAAHAAVMSRQLLPWGDAPAQAARAGWVPAPRAEPTPAELASAGAGSPGAPGADLAGPGPAAPLGPGPVGLARWGWPGAWTAGGQPGGAGGRS